MVSVTTTGTIVFNNINSTNMPFKHKIYFLLAAVHVVMIILFASHFTAWANMDHPVPKALSVVGNYTNSNNVFSFFAPGLSDQPYVVYMVQDKKGKERMIDLQGRSPEFINRVNNIYGYLTLNEARTVISASLAQAILRRYPESEKIRVSMVIQQIPDMPAHRSGDRSQWQFWFYRDYTGDTTLLTKR